MPISDRTFLSITAPSPLSSQREQIEQLVRQINFVLNLQGGVIRSLAGEDGVPPTISADLNLAGNRIVHLGDPVDDQDAATRAWVMNQQAEQDNQLVQVQETLVQTVNQRTRFQDLELNGGNYGFSTTTFPASAVGVLAIRNATTAPTGDVADQFSFFASDNSSGVSCPTFRTEAGDVLRLFRTSALTAVDNTAINATYDATEEAVLNNVRTRLNEVVARLQTLGLLA